MKGARHGVERVRGIRELVRLDDAAEALGCGKEQPVVGTDVEPPFAIAERERAARAADPRVDDREVHACRHVRQRVRKRERALEDPPGTDAVRDVDQLRVGRDPLDHAVAGADEIVLEAEVGEEGDEHLEGTYGFEQALDVVRGCDRRDLEAERERLGGRLRPDRDDGNARAGRGEGPHRGRRGEQHEVARTAPAGAARRCGRAARSRRRARRRAAVARPRRPRAGRGPAAARRGGPPASRRGGRDRRAGRARRARRPCPGRSLRSAPAAPRAGVRARPRRSGS